MWLLFMKPVNELREDEEVDAVDCARKGICLLGAGSKSVDVRIDSSLSRVGDWAVNGCSSSTCFEPNTGIRFGFYYQSFYASEPLGL